MPDDPGQQDFNEEAMSKTKKSKMFISTLPGELVEVVVAEEGQVLEYYVEMVHQNRTKGNIYKGYIHNVDAALQAAFINYGAERNGFLQVDEVHPEYYQGSFKISKGHRYPLLHKVLKPGQDMFVQVVKEPTGKKGAFLTSYLSLPGRYLVLTPGREQLGISRKVEDEKERARLKSILNELKPEPGVGVIVRTSSLGLSKTRILQDYKYLTRLWAEIKKKGQTEKSPALIYKEPDLAARAVRDYLTSDVSEVWVDDQGTFEQVKDFTAIIFPRRQNLVKHHANPELTLWERFNLMKQIEEIYSREVTLPSGGRLVFDQTEALTSVDINSGKLGGERNFKEMALRTNIEAAQAIAQHLRLRDIGGQVVIDFIELKDSKHVRELEKEMRQALKSDWARTDMGKLSRFGLMEVIRQRTGTSAISVSTEPCPCCGGTGIRRNLEWQALQALKEIYRLLKRKTCPDPLEYKAGSELALYLLNTKRRVLDGFEAHFNKAIQIQADGE